MDPSIGLAGEGLIAEDPQSVEDDDASLAQFLEEEVLSVDSAPSYDSTGCWDEEGQNRDKRLCIGKIYECESLEVYQSSIENVILNRISWKAAQPSIESGCFSKMPTELYQNILKFLSSEDLAMCARVCKFLRLAASEESLWQRLYCLRWGLPSIADGNKKPRGSAWKQLYFERDKADMIGFVMNTPVEFREYYMQMQAAKRSQAPLPSQINNDLFIVDATVAEQVIAWRCAHGLPDVYVGDHSCSGRSCAYYQIGDIFLCEKTGRAHVCDDACRETILDPSNDLLVCTVSGRCFDRWLSPAEESAESEDQLIYGNAVVEVEEPLMGSGRLARAYSLGYNCEDERELEAVCREVLYPGSNRRSRNSLHRRF
eukprot:c27313_g1_i1 orf=146-1258(+)